MKKHNPNERLDAALLAVLKAYIEIRDKDDEAAPFNRGLTADDPFIDLVIDCVSAFREAGHPVTLPLLASVCRTAYTDSKRKDKHAFPVERYDAQTLIDLSVWFESKRPTN
jgi:hypothetical protein